LFSVITDITQSLKRSGISKVVLINGHGGNYVLSNTVEEANVSGKYMALFLTAEDWKPQGQRRTRVKSAPPSA
jgi:creatinine amidohydrolase